MLGEQTRDVLGALGLTDAEIDALVELGVVGERAAAGAERRPALPGTDDPDAPDVRTPER
jgi:hypothetical protein